MNLGMDCHAKVRADRNPASQEHITDSEETRMQLLKNRPLLLTLAAISLAACQSDKPKLREPVTSMTPVCQECYDAVAEARRGNPAPGTTTNETVRTYTCPCCKTEMSVYIENGVHMVKCGGCASEGVAWDKCHPIDMSTE